MFLLALVALAAASAAPLRVLAGLSFEAFAQVADARCPARQRLAVTPGDLDLLQENFVDGLLRATLQRFAARNHAAPRCAGHNGLACPTTVTLDPMVRTRLLARFAAFACGAQAR